MRRSAESGVDTGTWPPAAAVTVTWRSVDRCLAALKSIEAMTPCPAHLIVVAQELSPDDRDRLLHDAPDRTSFVFSDHNIGFSAAANRGIDLAVAAGAEWVLLVNDDATVAPRCLARCVEEFGASADRLAIVSPAIVFREDPDRIWYAGGRFNHWLGYTRHAGLRRPVGQLPPSSDTDYVPGCCALISALAWRAVGPYREDYFLYFEDADWCYRARQLGWHCRYVADVLCWHTVSASTGPGSLGLTPVSAYYLARNPLRFALETPQWHLKITRLAGNLSVWLTYNLTRMVKARDRRVATAYWLGVLDALRSRMGHGPALGR